MNTKLKWVKAGDEVEVRLDESCQPHFSIRGIEYYVPHDTIIYIYTIVIRGDVTFCRIRKPDNQYRLGYCYYGELREFAAGDKFIVGSLPPQSTDEEREC